MGIHLHVCDFSTGRTISRALKENSDFIGSSHVRRQVAGDNFSTVVGSHLESAECAVLAQSTDDIR